MPYKLAVTVGKLPEESQGDEHVAERAAESALAEWDFEPGSVTITEETLQERTGLTPTVRTWTVIGFWYEDELIVAGVVEGDHFVYGGDVGPVDGSQGEWASAVEASTVEEAESLAVERAMAAKDEDEDDEDPSA